MIPRLRGAEYLRDYKIFATFEDGRTGVVDLEHALWGGVFEPLREVGLFRRFRFDPELDTIVWPTGADLAPEFLYENAVAGELQPVVESAADQPFFPVSKVRVNAASEYASNATAPLMSPARVDALQFRCGSWVDKVLKRYGPALASRPVVDFRPGSMNAAGRLLDMERTGT